MMSDAKQDIEGRLKTLASCARFLQSEARQLFGFIDTKSCQKLIDIGCFAENVISHALINKTPKSVEHIYNKSLNLAIISAIDSDTLSLYSVDINVNNNTDPFVHYRTVTVMIAGTGFTDAQERALRFCENQIGSLCEYSLASNTIKMLNKESINKIKSLLSTGDRNNIIIAASTVIGEPCCQNGDSEWQVGNHIISNDQLIQAIIRGIITRFPDKVSAVVYAFFNL